MASSLATLNYPSSGEYNVLVQRFKLLNLVQRVAHRDVSEMIDTVGLEGLARNGTLSKWVWSNNNGEEHSDDGDFGRRRNYKGTGPRYTGYGKYTAQRSGGNQRHRTAAAVTSTSQRTSPHFSTPRHVSPLPPPRMFFGRSTTGFEARVVAAQSNNGVEEDNDGESHKYGVTRPIARDGQQQQQQQHRDATRRRYVVRRTQRVLRSSPADRDAFFSRLAEPRERPEPVVEDVLVYDNEVGDEGLQRQRLYDYYAGQSRGAAATAAAPSLSPVLSSHGSPRASLRDAQQHQYSQPQSHRAGAGWSASKAPGDLRTHFYGAPSMYPPRSHLPAPSLSTLVHPGEGRYNSDYHDAGGDRRRGDEAAFEDDADALSSALALPSRSQRQQQQTAVVLSASSSQLHRGGDEEGLEPHGMKLAPPSTRPSPVLRGEEPGVVLSADGPMRRRSVNFALSEEGGYEGSHGDGSTAPHPDNYVVSPSVNASAADVLAATALAPYTRGCGHDQAVTATPVVPQLQFPQAGGSGGAGERIYGDTDDTSGGISAALNIPGSGRSAIMGASASSPVCSPAGLRGCSGSGITGFPKSPRVGRGLAPKAKPKGAVEDSQVPIEAVRHAAALITRSGSTPGSGASPATSTPGNSLPAAHKISPHPQVLRVATPQAVSAFSGGGILLSPRPGAVSVNTDRRQAHADSSAAHLSDFPASSAAATAAQCSVPVASRVMPPTHHAASSVSVASAVENASTSAVDAPAMPPRNEGVQQSFQAVSSQVDHMLQNLQRVLQRVLKDGDEIPASYPLAGKPSSNGGRGGHDNYREAPSSQDAYTSSFEDSDDCDGKYAGGTVQVNLDSDNAFGEDGEEEDEMLLYTRIQHKVSRLGAEMKQVTLPSSSNNSNSGDNALSRDAGAVSHQAEANNTAPFFLANAVAAASSSSALLPGRPQVMSSRPTPRRARGELPDAIVQRLCAYRMEHFQYIAYNERLWNTSTTSQFVFAQRLTAALLEECWAEVMAEVDANMGEYVEGLVEHELQ